MPVNIRVIHTQDFLRATKTGVLDLESSKKLLLEVATASAPLIDYDILLDTRMAQSELSENDLLTLASKLREHFVKALSRDPKMAILCPEKRFDRAKFFALCARHSGFKAKAFTEIGDAYEWLVVN